MRAAKAIVKNRVLILVLALALMIPSVFGMLNTRINYDMLNYLPDDMDTVIGQNTLKDDFGKGAFSFIIVEDMPAKDVAALKEKIEAVDHVDTVLWYDSLADLSVPMEMLPDKLYDAFNSGNATMMAVFFDSATSEDVTMDAIRNIRAIAGKQCFVSGMSALVTDLKDLCEKEEPIYVGIAVLLACAAMVILLDGWLVPFVFLASIGMMILINLGTNYFFGEISYITKALSAVLQLAVTMDYSIFLYHSYKEQLQYYPDDHNEAMAHAITATISSVVGGSTTTIAGFLAMCFMSFTLGLDLGIVMSKGVVCGVIACVTVLPAMILMFDKAIEKTSHKDLMPSFSKTSNFISKHSWIFITMALVLLIPAYYGYKNYNVYYKLDSTLPSDLQSVVANSKLQEEFNMNSTHILMADASLDAKQARNMIDEMNDVDGVQYAVGFNSLVGSAIPEEVIPDSVKEVLKGDEYQLILIGSEYEVATDEVNDQVAELNDIAAKYDDKAMLIGEAPATKDLITITDHDFQVVSILSIAAVFLIILVSFKSISLPIILVSVIELAIMINLGIAYFTNTDLPFIASVVIGTIQLGATVDYAILMTTRYRTERYSGKDKKEAVGIALNTSIKSIVTSALGFFAATVGVAVYSKIGLISSLCMLLARGALISMVIVATVLPSLLLLLDKIICKTSAGFIPKEKKSKKTEISIA